MKQAILKRLREPSTWAGLGILLTLFGVPPGVAELVGQLATAGAGLAAIGLAEAARD